MAHQQSITELLIILYQERILIAELYEKREQKRLYQKSEILSMCRENEERLDRLLQGEILKPRGGSFELNQSLIESFTTLLKLPSSYLPFSFLISELKRELSELKTGPEIHDLAILHKVKRLFRNLEESFIHELEREQVILQEESINMLSKKALDLQAFIWQEHNLQIYRDSELEVLIQDLSQLLREGLKSLENLSNRLCSGKTSQYEFLQKLNFWKNNKAQSDFFKNTNFEEVMKQYDSLLLDELQNYRPRITSQQIRTKAASKLISNSRKRRLKT